ncbi:hypothetical protein BRADI_1g27478v3 [Brachypodium distachyon]|uniref:DUF7597 domain-containing protein n=1 Tax=Brachypodium distachyon TaxID=15368 RepID=A0A2K2DLD1_BRADI|nr:hypothetical protein BRADI_1g27478v3 [Brachypodium distachyon]
MANFEFNPGAWVPEGLHWLDGGEDQNPEESLYVGEPPHRHNDEYAIAVVDPPDPDLAPLVTRQNTLNEVLNVVSNPLHNLVVEWSIIHPFCAGVVRFADVLVRDQVVSRSGFFHLAGDRVLYFTRQSEGRNARRTEGLRVFYVMFLGWPIDYCNERLFRQAMLRFGFPLNWVNPHMKEAYILIRDLDGVLPLEEDFPEATRNRHALLPPPEPEDGWELWGHNEDAADAKPAANGLPQDEQDVPMPNFPAEPRDHRAPQRPLGLLLDHAPIASDSLNSSSDEAIVLRLGPDHSAPGRRALPGLTIRSPLRDPSTVLVQSHAVDPELQLFAQDLGIASAFDRDLQIVLLDQHEHALDLKAEGFDPSDPKGKKAADGPCRSVILPGTSKCSAPAPVIDLGGRHAPAISTLPNSPVKDPFTVPASSSAIWPSPMFHIPGLTPQTSAPVVPLPESGLPVMINSAEPVADLSSQLLSQNQLNALQDIAPTSAKKKWLIQYLADLVNKEASESGAKEDSHSAFSPIRKLDTLLISDLAPASSHTSSALRPRSARSFGKVYKRRNKGRCSSATSGVVHSRHLVFQALGLNSPVSSGPAHFGPARLRHGPVFERDSVLFTKASRRTLLPCIVAPLVSSLEAPNPALVQRLAVLLVAPSTKPFRLICSSIFSLLMRSRCRGLFPCRFCSQLGCPMVSPLQSWRPTS